MLKKLVSQTKYDMLAFLKKIDKLTVVEKIAYAWAQISPKALRKSWHKFIPLGESSVEENAISLEQWFLTWGPRTPWGSVEWFKGVRECLDEF